MVSRYLKKSNLRLSLMVFFKGRYGRNKSVRKTTKQSTPASDQKLPVRASDTAHASSRSDRKLPTNGADSPPSSGGLSASYYSSDEPFMPSATPPSSPQKLPSSSKSPSSSGCLLSSAAKEPIMPSVTQNADEPIMPSVTLSSPQKLPSSSKSPPSSGRLSSAKEPIMPSVTQNADGKTCSVTQNADGITYSLRIDDLSYYEQVKTLLGANGKATTTTTNTTSSNNSEPNATRSNTSELDSVKKNPRPLLFNNKHVEFSKVEEFKLDFNSFASTRGHFGAVNARTPVANRKASIR
jgi:hypothetical protein